MTIDKSIASNGIALLLIALGVFLDGAARHDRTQYWAFCFIGRSN